MEQRKALRFAVGLPISFSSDEVAGGGVVFSLSRVGCTVLSGENVQPGTYLILRLHLPEEYSPLKVDLAVVRWATGWEFGAEFTRLRREESLQNTHNWRKRPQIVTREERHSNGLTI